MNHTLTVKGVVIGEGAPKICVPMVGASLAQLKEEAIFLQTQAVDLVEWRADFFEEVEDLAKVKAALTTIRFILKDIPLIFTFRSAKEGGMQEVPDTFYLALNKAMIANGQVDLIDVELFNDEKNIQMLIEGAHAQDIKVIISNHDFEKTPSKEEIVSRLCKAQALGGDLLKIAVMPKNAADVLTLLDATLTMKEHYADRPLITMSMAGWGVISRLAGELFGSAMTFGVARQRSAPGQVGLDELRKILTLLHHNLITYN